jgi:hypothetical protein
MVDGDCGDDVTLVLIRMPEAPKATAVVDLPSKQRSVAVGREFAVATVDTWDCSDGETRDTVELLTSELLTVDGRRAEPRFLRPRRFSGSGWTRRAVLLWHGLDPWN